MSAKAKAAALMAIVLTLVLLAAAGCGSSDDTGQTVSPRNGRVDIRGYVADVWGISADPRPGGVLGSILIEGEFEEDTDYDRASVTITDKTRIYEEIDGELEEISFDELAVGQFVQAVFTGPVAESYPVQATASEIVVLGSTAIGKVKDRHEAELFAVDGVVGMGISSRNGEPVIVVFLENESPELRAAVPTELEGFKVITEVTGPIEAQQL